MRKTRIPMKTKVIYLEAFVKAVIPLMEDKLRDHLDDKDLVKIQFVEDDNTFYMRKSHSGMFEAHIRRQNCDRYESCFVYKNGKNNAFLLDGERTIHGDWYITNYEIR